MAVRETIVRSPVRISFGGGGTDLEAYYGRYGGFVVSGAIARYTYAAVRDPGDRTIRISSADYRVWESYTRGEIPAVAEPLILPKAAVASLADHGLRESGADIFTASEVPPGTGLGSSSAMAAALLQVLHAYLGQPRCPASLAESASALEIERLDMPIGKQDQYASAFGGLNAITFRRNGVEVVPLRMSADAVSALNSRLLLFSTGKSRHSANILREQRDDTTQKPMVTGVLHRIKALALEMREALEAEDLDGFAWLLHESWEQKRKLSGRVSSGAIDAWYQMARAAGALGGKITGAGGGGFLLLYCPGERQAALRAVMAIQGLQEMPFEFDFEGTRVLQATEIVRPDGLEIPEHIGVEPWPRGEDLPVKT